MKPKRKIVPILITEDIPTPISAPLDDAVALQRQTELLPMDLILKLNKGEATETDLYAVVFHLNSINAMDRHWTIDSLAEYTGLNKRFEATKGLQRIIDHYIEQGEKQKPLRRSRSPITHPIPRSGKRCPDGTRYNRKNKLCHPILNRSRSKSPVMARVVSNPSYRMTPLMAKAIGSPSLSSETTITQSHYRSPVRANIVRSPVRANIVRSPVRARAVSNPSYRMTPLLAQVVERAKPVRSPIRRRRSRSR